MSEFKMKESDPTESYRTLVQELDRGELQQELEKLKDFRSSNENIFQLSRTGFFSERERGRFYEQQDEVSAKIKFVREQLHSPENANLPEQ